MTLNRQYIFYASVLFFVLATGYWAYHGRMTVNVGKKATDHKEHADYFLEQAKIVHYSSQGLRDYQLTSSNVSHYPTNDVTLLSNPHMEDYRKTDQVVDSKAIHGKWLAGVETLVLWDDVVMTQENLETKKTVRMETNYLTIHSAEGVAETDKPVLITGNNSTTRAVGMKSFYDKGIIQLKSSVRGLHVPD